MAGITTFLDPAQLPGRTQDQKLFDTAVAYVMQNWPTWGGEVNATWAAFNAALASVNAIAAGGAYALPYVFDSPTADADPGAGKLRLSSATQNASTTMRLDVLANGQDVSSILDTFDASTSMVKGSIRLVKLGDATKWLTFDVATRAAPTGYRNITVTNTGGSSASPFVAGDPVMLLFQRNGDKGDIGQPGFSNMVVLPTTQNWTAPAGVTKGEVTVIDGGCGGAYGVAPTDGTSNYYSGGNGGNSGVSIVAFTPGASYTATIGQGSAPYLSTGTATVGGSSSLVGTGVNITSANAALKIPGGRGTPSAVSTGNTTTRPGGGSMLSPSGSTGYGAGAAGGVNASQGPSGQPGVVIIRY